MSSATPERADKEREGVPVDEFLDEALYGPAGFYTRGGGAGRRGDFLTSPEIGGLFGAVVARALDATWDDLGRPDPFTVVEAGAGRGALARSVLDSAPACAGALRYWCVERSPVLRRLAGEVAGTRAAGRFPAGPLTGVVVANELLDNLGFRLLERRPGGWAEVLVAGGGSEVVVPALPEAAERAAVLAPEADAGARIPLQDRAASWLAAALAALQRGKLVVVDYADVTPSLARRPWRDWVRTYRGQQRGGHPWADPGSHDVTCEVAVDQLAAVRPPDRDRSQAEWLAAHGVDDLVAEARATWHERAQVGDLAALAARSRVGEAAALCDPAGLGAFRVLEWDVPAPASLRTGGRSGAGSAPHLPPIGRRGEGATGAGAPASLRTGGRSGAGSAPHLPPIGPRGEGAR
ncbi:MAG TPA: SAM-dependent methyltransferase [Acidimicrobiales bacterium]|nr:SAM-dependent methyltransferase [Acidimicrobiales bacterium]